MAFESSDLASAKVAVTRAVLGKTKENLVALAWRNHREGGKGREQRRRQGTCGGGGDEPGHIKLNPMLRMSRLHKLPMSTDAHEEEPDAQPVQPEPNKEREHFAEECGVVIGEVLVWCYLGDGCIS